MKEIFTPPSSPHSLANYAHLSLYVNNNDKYMQVDHHTMMQQAINLRVLVSKNTKSCHGELACYYN